MTLLEELRVLKLDHVANIQGTKIAARKPKAYSSTNDPGCTGCMFQKDGGAADCDLKSACMAHKRPDNNSVIFKLLTK